MYFELVENISIHHSKFNIEHSNMSGKYPKYDNLSLPELDKEILKHWEEYKTFEKSVSSREGKPSFTFYEGPPSANGKPGIHHVIARTIKDLVCRYKTLKGFQVKRKGGWDTHGLPVELQVEKRLGINKEDIGKKISIKEYNAACRTDVLKFKDLWDDLTVKMGYWVDLDDPYITFENNYIESVWNLLKRLWDKGYLYKGFTIQPYSPAAGTGLSSHELNQPGTYRDIKDTTIVAQFKIKNAENDYFLAWTTTPWTLPANTALAVGKNITYVKVSTFNQYTFQPINVILAKDLLGKYFPEKNAELNLADYQEGDKAIPFEVVEEMKGSDLEGMQYEQLMPYVQPENLLLEYFWVILSQLKMEPESFISHRLLVRMTSLWLVRMIFLLCWSKMKREIWDQLWISREDL